MDGVCLSELPADVGVNYPVVHKQGVIRTLLLTHNIHGLRSIDTEVLGKVHYAHYHVTILRSLKCFNLTLQPPSSYKDTHFLGKFLFGILSNRKS